MGQPKNLSRFGTHLTGRATRPVEKFDPLSDPALNDQARLGRVLEERNTCPDSLLNVGDATPGLKDFSIPFNPDPDDGVCGEAIN